MRAFATTVLLTIVVATACAPPAGQESTGIADKSTAWQEAFNRGDVATLVALYTDDAQLMPPNSEPSRGADAVAAAFGGMIEQGIKVQLETTQAMAAGDLGYRVGLYTLETADGGTADEGKFVEIWQRVDGDWRIRHDIWNSNRPALGFEGPTMSVSHEVKDADLWLAAWRGENSRHELFARHGAARVRTYQSPDNPNLTGLVIDVADMAALEAMLSSEEGEAAKAEDGVKDATLRILLEVE